MAVGLTGGRAMAKVAVVETDEEPPVGSEEECEAFITVEDGTGKCLLLYGDCSSHLVEPLHEQGSCQHLYVLFPEGRT